MDGLREAIERAAGEVEDDDSALEPMVDTSIPTEEEAIVEEAPVEEEVAPVEAEATPDEAPVTEEVGDQPEEQRADSEVKTEKPPVGWSPKSREHWADLPDDLKTQINKREREVNQVLQQSSNARSLEKAFTQTVEPYKAMMASQGETNPIKAIDGLMRTAATLSMGTPQQKAQRVAQLISHYGIDINTLDDVLVGNPETQQAPDQNQAVNQAVNQALAPFMQQQQQQQQYQQQQTNQRVQEGINKVAEREFFPDVRMDMADIMEMGSKRGQVVTLGQAYDRAIQMNPEIAGVIAARKASGSLQAKKAAGQSINGKRGGIATGGGDLSMHDTISTLWEGNEL